MRPRNFIKWTGIATAVFALVLGTGLGNALAVNVPTCNGFDATGTIPMFFSAGSTTGTTNCTDYFGSGNWANSPLPSSPITGFTMIAGGSGYANPQVVIADPAGSGASATATADATGIITGVTLIGGGTGYIVPIITIVDVGVGGAIGAPTCGGAGQPACGSGAMVTAVLGGPYTGGMLKFQAADTLGTLGSLPVTLTIDQTTFPDADYYEIGLVQYTQKMHSSLPPTTLRGYVQFRTGSTGCDPLNYVAAPSYLGPTIIATKDRPIRIKFTNCLPTGAAGSLPIPSDPTYMGAGAGPGGQMYTENRATLHLHGGLTPWISDGTPHQWTAPVGETSTTLLKGDAVAYVPDMFFDSTGKVTPVPKCASSASTNCYPNAIPAGLSNNPGQGQLTFYWTNHQGGRLMMYHDHAYGITRLNPFVGEAAGFLLVDPAEEHKLATANAGVPGTLDGALTQWDLGHLIPLVIQDKTFVPSAAQIAAQDPTWSANYGTTPGAAHTGDLWFPHVYLPNQNPNDPLGANGFGRWDYGPWFHPPQTSLTAATPNTAVTTACTSAAFPGQVLAPTAACPTCGCPITPNPSGTPEAFMDTPVVNGVAYPVLHVAPEAYRFKILTVGNDRSSNLSWFIADPTQGNTEVAMVPAAPPITGSAIPLCTAINPISIPSLDLGLATGLLDATGNPLNGTGLQANCWPNYGPQPGIPKPQTMWAADGRAGGAPDPRTAGPAWIQLATEGGMLPAPVVIPPTPATFEQNVRSITIGNVAVHGLWIGPAERADVIVDFSKFAGKTLILYNDAPAPVPAFDSRLDYFTGDGDQTPIGGAPNTPAGYGPNTRTIMQVIVDAAPTSTVPFSLPALKTAFASSATTSGVFASTQPMPVVPEAGYGSAYNTTFPNTYAAVQATNLTFTPMLPQTFDQPCTATPPATCATLGQKAIHELFTADYGRMNALLGVELPLTNFLTQTTIPYGYIDPPTEIVRLGDSQLWKITHNGVDTHFIHFHLFDVQVVNRVGWDGSIRPPDANELGWKDTVRMNPLESIVVALRPDMAQLPFPLPDSVRNLDVTMPAVPDFTNVDPNNAPVTVTNTPINFGWEYVWHCHILGHEENDMMRPIIFQVPPAVPTSPSAASGTNTVQLAWLDNSASEDSFTVQRDTSNTFPAPTSFVVNGMNSTGFSKPGWNNIITYTDTSAVPGTQYYYRVQANDSATPVVTVYPTAFQPQPISSAWSTVAANNMWAPVVSFTGAPASAVYSSSFVVTAATNAGVMPSITSGGSCTVGAVGGTSTAATATVLMTSGTGTCTMIATWPSSTTFAAAALSQTTIAVPAVPAATFTGAPASAAYNTSYPVKASTNAGVMPTIAGTANVCTVGAVSGLSTNATATVTMISGTGTCTLTASWPATGNYTSAVLTQSTSAVKDNSTTKITANTPNPSVAAQPVTVNFSVASAVALTGGAAGPSGSVTISGGGQSCTGTLNAGAGSCSLTFPSAGSVSLTAAYGGDANFNTSASSAVTQQVRDFSIVYKAPTAQSVNGNQKATYTVTLTSLNNFTGTVALGCGGNYPSSFTCTVVPSSVTLSAGGSNNATVTVKTAAGFPGTYNVTTTGVSGSGVPATGGLTHSATATVTTKN